MVAQDLHQLKKPGMDSTHFADDLLQGLHEVYATLREEMANRWKRDLPLEELLTDRWQRACQLGFGAGSSIYQSSYVYGEVAVGRNTWIGPMTLLDGSGGLAIGDYCSISAGVQIYTHDTVAWAVSGGKAAYQRAAVKIGDCCHIGAQTVINKGVNIGDHCVIGACSFVNRDMPPYSIGFGVPCRQRGRISLEKDGCPEFVFEKTEGR